MAIFPPQGRRPRKAATEPTPIQARVLEYIGGYRSALGYSPTYQEIADHLGRSKVTAFEHVQALRRKGLVTVGDPHQFRGLRPTGCWSPSADLEPVDELIGLRWQRDVLASACREALAVRVLTRRLRRKLEDAVRLVEVCRSRSSLPSVA